jgi:hypothetical protein
VRHGNVVILPIEPSSAHHHAPGAKHPKR